MKFVFYFGLLLFTNTASAVSEGILDTGNIGAAETQMIPLDVRKNDYLRGTVIGSSAMSKITILDPEGRIYKQLSQSPVNNQFFQLHAEADGQYFLKLVAGSQAVDYKVDIASYYSADFQHGYVEKLKSPRLRQLQKTLAVGGSTETFWSDMAAIGTPLVEAHNNERLKRVTFLWRGAERNVRLLGSPVGKHAFMHRLGDSDVWYLTMDLPDTSRLSYQFSPDTPNLPHVDTKNRISVKARAQIDPLNKHPWSFSPIDNRFSLFSTLTLEHAPSDYWLRDHGQPQGLLKEYKFYSQTLGNERSITVYKPQGLQAKAGVTPLLFFFDSKAYQSKIPTPQILDNLIAEKKIPPSVAVFVSNPTRRSRAIELPCNTSFAKFMATELLPWVEKTQNLKSIPQTTLLSGASYGGLASACIAFEYPEKFGLVLSQSGSFWWSPEYKGNKDYRPEWVPAQFAKAEPKPIRFYLNAGVFEQGWQPSDILPSNRHFNNVLIAKQYDVFYEELASGHDYFSWRVKLADGLIHLLNER